MYFLKKKMLFKTISKIFLILVKHTMSNQIIIRVY